MYVLLSKSLRANEYQTNAAATINVWNTWWLCSYRKKKKEISLYWGGRREKNRDEKWTIKMEDRAGEE